jgi:hypothetical protein
MITQHFRTDPAGLIAALTAPELVQRWSDTVAAELPSLADRRLLVHLRRLLVSAKQAQSSGFNVLSRRDPAASDELLTDLFAVARWQGWELPVTPLPDAEFDPAGRPRGLLGADPGRDGAGLWVVDHATIAFARQRESGDEAEWDRARHRC